LHWIEADIGERVDGPGRPNRHLSVLAQPSDQRIRDGETDRSVGVRRSVSGWLRREDGNRVRRNPIPVIDSRTADRSDESVPRTRNRLHVPRRSIAVAERFAQPGNVNREDPLLDEATGPDLLEQLPLGDQPPRVANQVDQDVVPFWCERNRLAASRETALRNVQRQFPERV